MPTITDLYSVHHRELDLALAESDLLLQKEGGLDGELKTSGSLCEQFLRKTLSSYIVPGHFRLTSGYIATPELLEKNQNLPQCDVLIADGYIPPLLRFSKAEIEVLPIEAVTGIIEAKRRLTKKSLADALDHLEKIIKSTGHMNDLKTDRDLNGFNKYVGIHNHSSNKPLLGIVALSSTLDDFANEAVNLINQKNSLVDFIWTMDGHALFPAFKSSSGEIQIYTHTARPETKTWNLLKESDFRQAPSNFYKAFSGQPVWLPISTQIGLSREAVFARVIGLVSLTTSRIFPGAMREDQINSYYLKCH